MTLFSSIANLLGIFLFSGMVWYYAVIKNLYRMIASGIFLIAYIMLIKNIV
jgi:hypothetical protein